MIRTTDHFASRVAGILISKGWTKKKTVTAVQSEVGERLIREAFKRGNSPDMTALALIQKMRQVQTQEIRGLAKGSSRGGVRPGDDTVKLAIDKGTRAGNASGRVCAPIPYTPPVYVSMEVGEQLEQNLLSALSRSSKAKTATREGMAWGGHSRRSSGGKTSLTAILATMKVTSNSWGRGGALYVSSSKNGKIGAVDTTWASVEATCVDCQFLTERRCYTMSYPASRTVDRLDAGARRTQADANQTALDEADCIRASYYGGTVPEHRILRIHSSGDTSTIEGAKAIASAVRDWRRRGGAVAYTYTHAWRRVPREAFGDISVLASINPGDDAREAVKRGYRGIAATVSDARFAERMTIQPNGNFVFRQIKIPELGLDLNYLTCPAQYPVDVRGNYEAFVWKLYYLAAKLGITSAEQADKFVEDARKNVEFSPENWKDKKVNKTLDPQSLRSNFSKNKLIMSMREQIMATVNIPAKGPKASPTYFPDPASEAFQKMFRPVMDWEKATCDKCKQCYDDKKLPTFSRGIAFRGDRGDNLMDFGVVPTESLTRHAVEKRIAESAEMPVRSTRVTERGSR